MLLAPVPQSNPVPNLSQYTGKPLNDLARDFCSKLEARGFTINTSNQGRAAGNSKKTLRIEWKGVYVGYMHYNLWRGGLLYGYRFNAGRKGAQNNAPGTFSLEEFCREHGCTTAAIGVRSETEGVYVRVRDEATALRLLEEAAAAVDGRVVAPEVDDLQQLERDLNEIDNSGEPETVRRALREARVGQGKFREDLERIFAGRCAVSAIGIRAALRASHVVPWRNATNVERLDPNNGLLLSANLDALFDRFLITFDGAGRIRISEALEKDDLASLGPLKNLLEKPTKEQAAYLDRHNAVFDACEERLRANTH